ncbi:MAG: UDP binding domain-containing protein, partial [Actinomycetota bacterium]
FVELAQEINAGMPAYVVRRIQDILNEQGKALRGAKVLLLGVTYKPDIADQRESPAKPIAQQLIDKGADVTFHDPHVRTWHLGGASLDAVPDLDDAIDGADVCVLLQNHAAYDIDALSRRASRFFDTRGVTTDDKAVRL